MFDGDAPPRRFIWLAPSSCSICCRVEHGIEEVVLRDHGYGTLVVQFGGPPAEPLDAAVQPWGLMTSIVTGARPEKPNARAAAGITSMIRPGTNGPRSLIRTTTARPLCR